MHPPALILQQLLIDLNQGTLPESSGEWPIYVSDMPDAPDSCLTITDTDGMVHGRSMPTGAVFEHFGVMVQCRSASYSAGYQKLGQVSNCFALNVRRAIVSVKGSNYIIHSINRSSTILDLGIETAASRRRLLSLNFLVNVRSLNQ